MAEEATKGERRPSLYLVLSSGDADELDNSKELVVVGEGSTPTIAMGNAKAAMAGGPDAKVYLVSVREVYQMSNTLTASPLGVPARPDIKVQPYEKGQQPPENDPDFEMAKE
jgi:hypothetical protein